MAQIETTAETLHEYLTQRLAHLPPPCTWPADEPPSATADDPPGQVAATVPEHVAAGLRRLADRLDVPVPAILTACLLVLMFRVRPPRDGTADDIVVATGASWQPGDWLPLQQSIDPAESFTDLVTRLCTELYVTGTLHEQSGSCRAADLALTAGVAPEDLYRAVLVLDNSGLATSAADLVLALSPRDGYRGMLMFATAKYTPATATRVVASYLALLDGVVAGPETSVGELPVVLSDDRPHPGLTDAVIVVHDSPAQDTQLVAYYLLTPGIDVPPSVLRRTLSSGLPDHMVPALFVALTGLPLTPSGKVDRRALANRPVPADPDAAYAVVLAEDAGTDQAEASTPIERVVAEAWTEALCRASIPVATDLFAVGGNSRTALEVSALLSEIFRVPVPVHLLFERPTVAGQAAWLTELDPSCPHSLAEIAERLLTYDVEVVGDH